MKYLFNLYETEENDNREFNIDLCIPRSASFEQEYVKMDLLKILGFLSHKLKDVFKVREEFLTLVFEYGLLGKNTNDIVNKEASKNSMN